MREVLTLWKISKKKKKRKNDAYNVGRNVTKSRRGKIRVAKRRSTRVLLKKKLKRTGMKKNIIQESGAELKMARKRRKSRCLAFSHLWRVSKKKRKRERKFHHRATRPLERVYYTRHIERSIASWNREFTGFFCRIFATATVLAII